jgi:hypothetical protein
VAGFNGMNCADCTRCDDAANLCDVWQETSPHCLHQEHIALLGGIDHRFGFSGANSKWFFTEDWLACIKSKQGIAYVIGMRCRNINTINGLVIH